jgi:hypothetical protein
MLTENQKALAKEIGQLNGAILHASTKHEDAAEFSSIVVAETANFNSSGNDVKDIAENVIDLLDAIATNLPDSDNPKKQKTKNRFKRATNFFKSLVGFFNLD